MGLLFMPWDAVKVIKGYPRVYHSSPTSDRHFCPACGSPLFFVRHTRSLCAVTVGSLDNPHIFKLEDGGRFDPDGRKMGFRASVDPHGLLNPGKLRSLS